ncbi:accessory Sec system S-layer assembly protein [Alkalicoccus daliensis]|uniref:Accessory Sec system S-layer assembly protein n=1 Tax=Alkalicoccus daliensis TaxID=745820 RepID=A0A1H0J229_9BACI|nr:accessory Sec system S-layer assembly protein [Alkalicoccus daliensis]SDO37797.1 accessory Sec system S-layer assembly protein [Alkalicoccus daliensis]
MSFFPNSNNEEITLDGRETIISSRKASQSEEENTEKINTELSFHPDWDVSTEDEKVFQSLHEQLSPLKPHQLSIVGIQKSTEEENHVFTAFIRHTLEKQATFKETTVELLGEDDKLLGRKTFNLAEIGSIPENMCRPWTFEYSVKDLFTEDLPETGWKLRFKRKQPDHQHELALTKSWNKRLTSENKRQLRRIVREMTPPKPGEINFKGLKATYLKERDELHISLLIRNGSDKSINLEKLPLIVEDASGEIVARGGFTLTPKLQVKAHTSTPWNFVFPSSMIMKKDPDLSRWKAYPPRKKKKD